MSLVASIPTAPDDDSPVLRRLGIGAVGAGAMVGPSAADPIDDAAKVTGRAATNIVDSGIWGSVAVIALGLFCLAIWWLIRQIKRRDDAIEARDKRIEELQDKRVEDAEKHLRLMAEQNGKSVDAISAQTHAMSDLASRVNSSIDITRALTAERPREPRRAGAGA